MVKRRNLNIVVETPDGVIENGKWVEKDPKFYPIVGRLQYVRNTFAVDANGDKVAVQAKFFTDSPKIDNVGFLSVGGRKLRVIDWLERQTYNVILLTS